MIDYENDKRFVNRESYAKALVSAMLKHTNLNIEELRVFLNGISRGYDEIVIKKNKKITNLKKELRDKFKEHSKKDIEIKGYPSWEYIHWLENEVLEDKINEIHNQSCIDENRERD